MIDFSGEASAAVYGMEPAAVPMSREQMIDEAVRRVVPAKHLQRPGAMPEVAAAYYYVIRTEFRFIAQEQP